MLSKGKITTVIIAVLIVAVAGFLWYRSRAQKENPAGTAGTSVAPENQEDASDVFQEEADEVVAAEAEAELEDFNVKCENGEWLKIGDAPGSSGSVSGKLRKVYRGEPSSEKFVNYKYFIEGADNAAITGQDLAKLDYFEDREVEVQGIVTSGTVKEIQVSQVKCGGKETDKNILENRKQLMNYIQANINTIAPQKAKYKKWTVDTVEFANENNVYVGYYDVIYDEDEDFEEDTGRQVLLEVASKGGGSYDAKVLAYWEMGEDDYVLKSGTDKFENAEDSVLYQYDPEKNEWSRD